MVMAFVADYYHMDARTQPYLEAAIKAFYQKVINSVPVFKFVLTRFEKKNDFAVFAGYVEVMGSKYPIAQGVLRQGQNGRALNISGRLLV